MEAKDKQVRIQVPVPAYVAEELAGHAKSIDRSVAWISSNLLEFVVEDRQKLVDWFGMAVLGRTYGAAKRLLTGKKRPKGGDLEEVRLQISVPQTLFDEIERLAIDARETTVRMAGKLLEAGLHQHELFLDWLSTRLVQSVLKAAKRRGGSSGSGRERHMPCVI